MERVLVATVIALGLASCAGIGGSARGPYDQNCSQATCDGHLLSGSSG